MNAYITPTLLDSITLNLMKLNIKDNVVHFAIPLLFGGLAYYNLYSAMQAQGEGISNAIWNCSSTILGVGTGYLLWNEQFDRTKLIGVGLGVAGIYLMNDPPFKI